MTLNVLRWTAGIAIGFVVIVGWFGTLTLIEVGVGRSGGDSTVLTLLVLGLCFGGAIGALALLARMGPRIDDDEPDDED